jgi:hypothetical protein
MERQVRLTGVVQRDRPVRGDVEVAADDLELPDLAGQIAIIGVYRHALERQPADGRRIQRHPDAAVDVLLGDAGRDANHGGVHIDRAPDDAGHGGLAAGDREIESGEGAVRRHVRRIVRHRGVEGDLRNLTAHHRRIRHRPAGGDIHLFRRRAAAFGGDVGVEDALVLVRRQRRHLELGANPLEVDVLDRGVGVVSDLLAMDVERDPAAGHKRGACDRRVREGRLAFHDQRLGGPRGLPAAVGGWRR